MKTVRKRRLEKKTDYKSRFGLLKSGLPRLVIRKTNKYVIAQIIETSIAQDRVLASINSQQLLSKGWPKDKIGSLKNKIASYLTGFLLGKMAREKKINEAILDIGMHRNIHKSRIYAVLRGAVDSGLKISHDPDALPSLEDLKKIKEFFPLIDKITKA